MSVDFTQLRKAVRDAARNAFTEVRTAHPEEHFYAFALYTDDGAMTIVPAANTEEGLQRSVRAQPDSANYYRWATGEWAYEAVGADEDFRTVYALLNVENRYEGEVEDGDDDEDDPNFAAFKQQVLETMIAALSELDAESFFGSGSAREQVTLFVSISDSDESIATENESARRLNPASAYARFVHRY